jgi:hypothetical protein
MGRSAQAPAAEWSSEKETVTEGLLPVVERFLEEETATVVGTRGLELRTPAVERSSEEETVTEGLLPAVERSSEIETVTEGLLPAGEETSTVDGTLEPIGTREELTAASDRRFGAASRTMVVEQSSGEETVTSSRRGGLRHRAYYLLSGPRERYTRQTSHQVHMRPSSS